MPTQAPAAGPPTSYLSTREITARDKLAALRELSGRELMRVDLWPHLGDAYRGAPRYEARIAALGEGTTYVRVTHTPLHLWRSPTLVQDGNDDIYLCRQDEGVTIRGPHGEFTAQPGGYVLLSKARVHEAVTSRGGLSDCVQLSRAHIARLAPGLEEAPLRALPPGAPGAALALAYGRLLSEDASLLPAQRQTAVTHLHELLAAVIAPGSQARLPPDRAATTAPRLALIQRAIQARLHEHALSLVLIARQHHLTPRQVQRLFAAEGTCFSDYVREARLARTHAVLLDPAQRHRRVLAIALDSGFADVSAFNRAFKRRYGVAPTELRGGL